MPYSTAIIVNNLVPGQVVCLYSEVASVIVASAVVMLSLLSDRIPLET